MTAALLDRESDLDDLETAWTRANAGEPQLVVVWGRRRVGKTFLLTCGREQVVAVGAAEPRGELVRG
jgi:AAA+ ATPase superfamily predicted ATPase